MKKIVLFVIVYILSLPVCASAANDADIVHYLNDGEIYIGGMVRTGILNVLNTGDGYLIDVENSSGNIETYFTSDFGTFDAVQVFDDSGSFSPFSRFGRMGVVKRAGDVYIARSNVYDNYGKSDRVLEDKGYLYILNNDFSLNKKIEFDSYVRNMAYVDGVFYVKTSNRAYLNANVPTATKDDIKEIVFSSTDLYTWMERHDLENVPLDNGTNVITLKGEEIYMFKNGGPTNPISYENLRVIDNSGPYSDTASQQVLVIFGEYFCVVNNDENNIYGDLWMSKDGVYFEPFILNSLDYISGTDALSARYESAYVLKSDIDKYLPQNPIYVNLNGVILGFAHTPVYNNNKVLAPLEFLVKSMGGEVSLSKDGSEITLSLSMNAEQSMRTFKNGGTNTIVLLPGKDYAIVNGKYAAAPPSVISDGVVYAPLRFVSENLGFKYSSDNSEQINITY